jgi:hypothetical protein
VLARQIERALPLPAMLGVAEGFQVLGSVGIGTGAECHPPGLLEEFGLGLGALNLAAIVNRISLQGH